MKVQFVSKLSWWRLNMSFLWKLIVSKTILSVQYNKTCRTSRVQLCFKVGLYLEVDTSQQLSCIRGFLQHYNLVIAFYESVGICEIVVLKVSFKYKVYLSLIVGKELANSAFTETF